MTTACATARRPACPNLYRRRDLAARHPHRHPRRRRRRAAGAAAPRQGRRHLHGRPVRRENGGSPGAIWKIDGISGAVSLFATIDGNSGPGIGDVSFDKVHRQFFASDLDTGLIHRIDADGSLIDTFDHGVAGRPAHGLAAGRRRRRGDGHPGRRLRQRGPRHLGVHAGRAPHLGRRRAWRPRLLRGRREARKSGRSASPRTAASPAIRAGN